MGSMTSKGAFQDYFYGVHVSAFHQNEKGSLSKKSKNSPSEEPKTSVSQHYLVSGKSFRIRAGARRLLWVKCKCLEELTTACSWSSTITVCSRHDKEAIIATKSVITSDSYDNDGGEDDDDDDTAQL